MAMSTYPFRCACGKRFRSEKQYGRHARECHAAGGGYRVQRPTRDL